ncbi:MAG: SMP-30/gluconolactonase/LRE family protein [Pseudomonadota bacterium]
MSQVFDPRPCTLGEGPLWHPERGQLFWFDIIEKRLMSRIGAEELVWQFDEHVSAAGWVDRDQLLIASETQLFVFNLTTGAQTPVCELEPGNPVTRSNDGRADPFGGFWIGTMGKRLEPRAGAIYRYYKGELRQLYDGITVTNSICFSLDRRWAYFCDTWNKQIMRVALDATGWPDGAPEVFVDLKADGLNPDGSVVDAEGQLWNAQWGAHRVACYGADGQFLKAVPVGGAQASCPAFGGDDLTTLFVTTAVEGLTGPAEGLVYMVDPGATGQREHQVIL